MEILASTEGKPLAVLLSSVHKFELWFLNKKYKKIKKCN